MKQFVILILLFLSFEIDRYFLCTQTERRLTYPIRSGDFNFSTLPFAIHRYFLNTDRTSRFVNFPKKVLTLCMYLHLSLDFLQYLPRLSFLCFTFQERSKSFDYTTRTRESPLEDSRVHVRCSSRSENRCTRYRRSIRGIRNVYDTPVKDLQGTRTFGAPCTPVPFLHARAYLKVALYCPAINGP